MLLPGTFGISPIIDSNSMTRCSKRCAITFAMVGRAVVGSGLRLVPVSLDDRRLRALFLFKVIKRGYSTKWPRMQHGIIG